MLWVLVAMIWAALGVVLLISGQSLFGVLWLVLAVTSVGVAWRERRRQAATKAPEPPIADAR